MTQEQLTGEQARDRAIVQVEQGVGSDWWVQAMKCVKAACLNRQEFTTDLVHAIMQLKKLPEPKEKRVMGALMRRAAKLKWCSPTQRTVKTKRKSAHARDVRVWRSRLK